jgi:predicted alpha-1,6-mannanase (GH76 family)
MWTNNLIRCPRGWCAGFAAAGLLLICAAARAVTPADADAIFADYHKAFYFTNASGGYYHATTEGGKTFFWDRAEQLEMILDAYERTTNTAYLGIFTNVFNGFVADHGRTWEKNDFNDDIMWMVIACARAHQFTGNPVFRELARTNFDLCFARAWSTNLGGGLWWKTANQSKNACVNGPGAIAAYLLYQIGGDTNDLAKSRRMFEWERAHLFDSETGQVFDNLNTNGWIGDKAFTYNEGTFIGAANFLGATNDARLAADYTRDYLCQDGILPGYGQDGDVAGFNGIFIRWAVKYMKQRHVLPAYEPWLQANANAAWRCRRPADGLAWSRWAQPTPAGPLYAWACSSAVVILQAVPPALGESDGKIR